MPATASPLLNLPSTTLTSTAPKTGFDNTAKPSNKDFAHLLGQADSRSRTHSKASAAHPQAETKKGEPLPQGKTLPGDRHRGSAAQQPEANAQDAGHQVLDDSNQAADEQPGEQVNNQTEAHKADRAIPEDTQPSGPIEELSDETTEPHQHLVFTNPDPIPTQPQVEIQPDPSQETDTSTEQDATELPSWLIQARQQSSALDSQYLEPATEAVPEASTSDVGLGLPEALNNTNPTLSVPDQGQEQEQGQTQDTKAPATLDVKAHFGTDEAQLIRQTTTATDQDPGLVKSTLNDAETSANTTGAKAPSTLKPHQAPTTDQQPPVQPEGQTQSTIQPQVVARQPDSESQPPLESAPSETPASAKVPTDTPRRETASGFASVRAHESQPQVQANSSSQQDSLGQGRQQPQNPVSTPRLDLDEELALRTTETQTTPSQDGTKTADTATSPSTSSELAKHFGQLLSPDSSRLKPEIRSLHQASELPQTMRTLDTPMGTKGWEQGVGERIHWMLGNGLAKAEIRLNPQHLGPLEIRVNLHNEQTHVSILAQHSATRDAIEASLPRLREMFQDANLNLGNLDVGRREAQQQGGQQYQNQGQHQGQTQGQNQAHGQDKEQEAGPEGPHRTRNPFAQAEEDGIIDFRRPVSRLSSTLIDDFA